MILINKVPKMSSKQTVEEANPLMSASTTSPTYIGSSVYMAPSVIPIISLKIMRCQIFVANAIPIKPKNVIGASSNIEFFLPILSAILAARTAPIRQPGNMLVAHQVPSEIVVGIVDEFDNRYGRYGELQPEFTPYAIVDKAAGKQNNLITQFQLEIEMYKGMIVINLETNFFLIHIG